MIEKIEVYIVQCECGEKLDARGDGGYTVFDEKRNAEEVAKNNEWEISNTGKVLCGYCIDKKDEK